MTAPTTLVHTSAGSKLYIGAAPATYDLSGFSGVSYTEVAEITNLGDYGKVYSLVTHNPVSNRTTFKKKGSYNNGTMKLTLGKASSDAGQISLLAASNSDSSYSIKVVLQSGEINQFTAQVMSFTTSVGSVNQITGAMCDLELDGDILVS